MKPLCSRFLGQSLVHICAMIAIFQVRFKPIDVGHICLARAVEAPDTRNILMRKRGVRFIRRDQLLGFRINRRVLHQTFKPVIRIGFTQSVQPLR